MSEIIDNSKKRKDLLKHMILQLHKGEAPEIIKNRLAELLRSIPYDEVVAVEQELISEGLPAEEVLKFCDIHQMVLEGHIDQSGARSIPEIKEKNISCSPFLRNMKSQDHLRSCGENTMR